MQHSRILKEIRHVKGSQIPDNESVVSHSKSSASYQFNHVKFTKLVETKNKPNPNTFHLDSVLKAKSKHKKHNLEYGLKKTSRENSLSSLLSKEQIDLTLKKKPNQKLEHNLKRFMQNVKGIHNQMKQMAENMLDMFEKIKDEMEANLIKVTEEMLKLSGQTFNASAFQEILHNGFEAIRKVAIQPLGPLSDYNGFSEQSLGQNKTRQDKQRNTSREVPLTPVMKGHSNQRRHTEVAYGSAFSTQFISPKCEFKLQKLDLNGLSKSKVRAQTQRKKGELARNAVQQPEQAQNERNGLKQQSLTDRNGQGTYRKQLMTMRSTDSTQNIDCIISQMREILNE